MLKEPFNDLVVRGEKHHALHFPVRLLLGGVGEDGHFREIKPGVRPKADQPHPPFLPPERP